jgi:tRNA G37 N-methylase TrmD
MILCGPIEGIDEKLMAEASASCCVCDVRETGGIKEAQAQSIASGKRVVV